MLVGITGYAQHGKDTVAQALVDELGYTRIGFADALKDLALQLNPLVTLSAFEPSATTRLRDLVEGHFMGHAGGWERAKKVHEVRRILQELGTGARELLGENVWLDAVERKMLSTPGPVVISDVRFPNEAAFVHRWHGTLVRVERPGFDNGVDTSHPSEAHVPHLPANVLLVNAGTLEELKAMALEALAGITVTT